MILSEIKQYLNLRSVIYFFALIAGWPCVFYLMGWLPHYQINYIALLLVSLSFVLIKGYGGIPSPMSNILLIQAVTWIFYAVLNNDGTYLTRVLMILITFLILRMQYTDECPLRFAKIYTNWLGLQVLLGSIGMIMVLSGALHPLFRFREMDMRWGYCFGLFTTNTFEGGLIRNAGFYDEPGALAFWGVYALLFNKLFIKNRIIEYSLIIGLLSTLSLAYFIQLVAYLYAFYKEHIGRLVIILAVLLLAMNYVTSSNEEIDQAVFGRFEYDASSGSIKGDNRSDLMRNTYKAFQLSPVIGVGAQKLASSEMHSTFGFLGANFFTNFAADGVIGVIITYLPLFYIFKLGRYNRKYKLVSLIMLLGFFQRPYDSSQLLYPLLTYSLLFLGYEYNGQEEYTSLLKHEYE